MLSPLVFLTAFAACRPLPLVEPEPPAAPIPEWQAAVDWDAAGEEAVQLLSAYLQVDTVNPPGNETRGAQFLGERLSQEGIPWVVHEFAPGRGSLVARIEGSGEAGPVCLLSHIDVVPSEDALWPEGRGPLSGTVDDEGYIWGRGALDMKGMGVLELMAMSLLHRQGVPLKRDVILLAVADEEVAGLGIRHLIDHHWPEIDCEYVINEGGMGIPDLLFEGQTIYPVSVGEKGFLWMKVIASGEPGHGSVPLDDTAPARLRRALAAVDAYEAQPQIHDSLMELVARAGRQQGGVTSFVLQREGLARAAVKGQLMGNPLTKAGITNTLNVTGFGGASSPNVLPSEVWFQIDSRLLPGTSPEDMLAVVEGLVADVEGVRVEVIESWPAGVTDWREDPFYQALTRNLEMGRDDVVAGPVLSPGFTDSLYLRPLGVKAYGMVPFLLGEADLLTMHGNGERVSTENVQDGVRLLYQALVEVAADPTGTAEPPLWGRITE